MALLELIHVSKRFGGVRALNDINLKVEQGEIHGLIGPNGAGKTTFFNCVTGIFKQTDGEIIFNGENISNLKTYKRAKKGLARTFQRTALFGQLSVLENVVLGSHLNSNIRISGVLFNTINTRQMEKEIEIEAIKILTFMHLIDHKDDKAVNLSHGHQRSLAISIALATKPKLLLLDEPLAGVSAYETTILSDLILAMRDKGITILLVEHDMKAVMRLCDKITAINYGEKLAEGTPHEVQNNPALIEAYLGSEDVNYVS
ncbi:ABC transporter ATP-binding protein [bacterium]|nr:ABC transporter ATP-binding protein [bacterium]